MTSDTPAQDFLLPRLRALLQEAEARGIARDVAVAVLSDLITGPDFNTAQPDPLGDSEPPPPQAAAPADAALQVDAKEEAARQVTSTGPI